ncbi:MAG: NAD(P)H-dependent glycerol-3-phosphate dehydrogenase [Flavobacteriaceae bacterium]|tara:strand:- start:4520 stop:5521 length:1002 start_codon:yes stop_codon:yes gene_type:complete
MALEPKYAVFGSGSWATAIVKMLCENLQTVHWYVRRPQTAQHIIEEKHNPSYLSSVEFDINQLIISTDINHIAAEADVLIFAIPSAFIHTQIELVTVDISAKIIVSAVKGIFPESGLLAGEYFYKIKKVPQDQVAVIGGPCHAEEVALERLSYLTIACKSRTNAEEISSKLSSHYIHTNIHDDVIGVEYAAMLKNIYAIAAGISHGLGYGDNFQSVLMSNAIREMKSYIKTVYKMKRKINETVYLGDLLVTGYSTFSRNRMFGNMIGKGYTVKSAQIEMSMVAEGYYATKSAFETNNNKSTPASTPIINAVYNILHKNQNPKQAFKTLANKLD